MLDLVGDGRSMDSVLRFVSLLVYFDHFECNADLHLGDVHDLVSLSPPPNQRGSLRVPVFPSLAYATSNRL